MEKNNKQDIKRHTKYMHHLGEGEWDGRASVMLAVGGTLLTANCDAGYLHLMDMRMSRATRRTSLSPLMMPPLVPSALHPTITR